MELLHPPFASFPFPLLCAAVTFELLFWWKKQQRYQEASFLILVLLVVITPVTYFTGYFTPLPSTINQIAEAARETHQAWAKGYLISLVPTLLFSVIRRGQNADTNRYLQVCTRLFLLCTLLLAGTTSFFGGTLVFDYGIGVKELTR